MKSGGRVIRIIGAMLVASTMLMFISCSSAPEIDGLGEPGPVLMENASTTEEMNLLAIYKDDVTYLYSVNSEKMNQMINCVNSYSTTKADPSSLKKFTQPAYAISTTSKDGQKLDISYSNGLWVTDEGVFAGGGYDFESMIDTASMISIRNDTMNFPTANTICRYNKSFYTEYSDFTAMDGLEIVLGDYSNGKIDISLTNNTQGNLTGAGIDYDLCIRVDGKWCYIPPKVSRAYQDSASLWSKGQSKSLNVDVDALYGELKSGDYRIVFSKLTEDYDKNPIGYADFKVN